MSEQPSLAEIERAMTDRVGDLAVDVAAAHAISNLYRAANAARQHLTARVLGPHQLTWGGFLVLWLLWVWGSNHARAVADSAGMSKANLTGVLRTLVDRGLVARVPDTRDRRLVMLSLTEAGERLMVELYPQFNLAEAELVSRLSAARVATLTQALRSIVEVSDGS